MKASNPSPAKEQPAKVLKRPVNRLSPQKIKLAEQHLRSSSAIMARLIDAHGPCLIARRKDAPFQILARSIIGQQLSAKAADTIRGRIREIVPSFTPEGFLKVSVEALRTAGLSAAKTRHLIELASRVQDGRLAFDALDAKSDEEVIATLIDVPGIGRWTAEMFLLFGLRRPNVLALGDAGLQRAMRLLYGDDAALDVLGRDWEPYCSVASWYLWRHLDTISGR